MAEEGRDEGWVVENRATFAGIVVGGAVVVVAFGYIGVRYMQRRKRKAAVVPLHSPYGDGKGDKGDEADKLEAGTSAASSSKPDEVRGPQCGRPSQTELGPCR